LGSGAKEWDGWVGLLIIADSWDEWDEHTHKLPSFWGYFFGMFQSSNFFRGQHGNMILLIIGKVGWGAITGNSEIDNNNNDKTW
jgi:hypothetical protein